MNRGIVVDEEGGEEEMLVHNNDDDDYGAGLSWYFRCFYYFTNSNKYRFEIEREEQKKNIRNLNEQHDITLAKIHEIETIYIPAKIDHDIRFKRMKSIINERIINERGSGKTFTQKEIEDKFLTTDDKLCLNELLTKNKELMRDQRELQTFHTLLAKISSQSMMTKCVLKDMNMKQTFDQILGVMNDSNKLDLNQYHQQISGQINTISEELNGESFNESLINDVQSLRQDVLDTVNETNTSAIDFLFKDAIIAVASSTNRVAMRN